MSERRAQPDRRDTSRGGRRLTDCAEDGFVSLTDAARYFASIDVRTLRKILINGQYLIVQLGPRRQAMRVEDVYKLEQELRLR